MEINSKEFGNNSITVTYDPVICQLSGVCAKQLSSVFRDSVIPWIDINGASTEAIKKQVKSCPSGALKFYCSKKDVA